MFLSYHYHWAQPPLSLIYPTLVSLDLDMDLIGFLKFPTGFDFLLKELIDANVVLFQKGLNFQENHQGIDV